MLVRAFCLVLVRAFCLVLVPALCLFLVSVHFLSAQSTTENAPGGSLPEGTWINMRVIEDLKANKSVTNALSLLRPDEFLVIRAVRQPDSTVTLFTSRELDEGLPTDVVIRTAKGIGDQRRINAFGKTWLLGVDKAKGEYIALHSTVDSNAKPDVFAYIPSRNQNADFIYQRVMNSATLAGTYRDAKGKVFSFSALQRATTPKLKFNYRILAAPGKPYQIMEIVSDKPRPVRYAYAWSGDTLVISTIKKNGSLKPLYKLVREKA